jgi:biotin operon repressor
MTVEILGTPQVRETLTADVVKNFTGAVTYQWFRNGTTYITSGAQYIPWFEDLGKTIMVKATCGDQTAESPSVTVLDGAYTFVIDYNQWNNTLGANIKFNGDDYYWTIPSYFSFQWYKNNVAISGAIYSSYDLQTDDYDKPIKIKVTSPTGKTFEPDPITVTYNSVIGVSLYDDTADITVGYSKILYAEISPDNATNRNVTWSSSNPSVATVFSDGLRCLVTAVSAGITNITVSTIDGNYTDICAVNVTADVPGTFNINATTLTINNVQVASKEGFWTDDNKYEERYEQYDESVYGLNYIYIYDNTNYYEMSLTLNEVFSSPNSVSLTNGKLSIQLGKPNTSVMNSLERFKEEGFKIDNEDAKYFELGKIRNNNYDRVESDEVWYWYVDDDVTITADGDGGGSDGINYTYVYNIELKSGWNAIIRTVTENSTSIEYKWEVGTPTGKEKWLINYH